MSDVYLIKGDEYLIFRPTRHFWHGCCAIGFLDKAIAEDFASTSKQTEQKIHVVSVSVHDLYTLMIESCEQGAIGICIFNDSGLESLETTYLFSTRLEETASNTPTLLAQNFLESSDELLCFSRFGQRLYKRGSVVPWRNYSYIDHLNQQYAPLLTHNTQNSMRIFELNPNPALLIYDEKILGPWGGIAGNYVFFTRRELAMDFLENLSEYKRARMTLSVSPHPAKTMDTEILEVTDFKQRLDELADTELCMESKWILNPNAHRSEMGFGKFLREGETILTDLSGRWLVCLDNHFQFLGRSSEDHSSSLFFKTVGLRYSYNEFHQSLHARLSSYDHESNLTDSEIEDVISYEVELIKQSPLNLSELWELPEVSEDIFDSYLVSMWDIITGQYGEPLIFSDVMSFLLWSLKFELYDRRWRIRGATGCHGTIGIPGSQSPTLENEKGRVYENYIRSFMKSVLKQSYDLGMNNTLVSLFNQTMSTQRIDLAGYGHDLISAYEISDENLSHLMDVIPDEIDHARNQDIHKYNADGLSLASKYMSEDVWDKLSENSKKSICTALSHYQRSRFNRNTDFSSIIVQMAKSMEIELNNRLREYVQMFLPVSEFESDGSSAFHRRTDDCLRRFIVHPEKGLTLGSLREVFRRSSKSSSLLKHLHSHVVELGHGYLLSKECFEDITQLIDTRNGSAHESIKTQDQADAFIRMMLGTSPHIHDGVLSTLIASLPDTR